MSKNIFQAGILIDNTAPVATFKEIPTSNNKSKAQITSNEKIRKLSGWEISNNNLTLSKEFTNYISYALPITDFAQNSTDVLIDIKSATNILLEYGTFDYCSYETLVSSGQISSQKTIYSNSICKTEAIFIRLAGNIENSSLQARYYAHTYWGTGASILCPHSELSFSHGYNGWLNVGSEKTIYYNNSLFSQLGGYGLNSENMVCANKKDPIPSNIATKYPFGISSLQFRLKNNTNFCVIYQAYVKDVGWLKASCDGEENFYKHDKPISAFRINIVPKSEKQYLINFWNRNS